MGRSIGVLCLRHGQKVEQMKRLLTVVIFALFVLPASANEGLGVGSWAGWQPGQVSRADCPELRNVPFILQWNKVEPEPGKYKFDQYVGQPLQAAVKEGLYVTLKIWVRPGTPGWLFDMGVPKVYTDRTVNPLGQKMSKEDNLHPYYLHPVYKKHFFTLIDAFGKYVNSLSPELRDRIIFVQSAEGSTGDGQPYKGNPEDKQYDISKDVWNTFRKETWARYKKAFPGIPILVNSDANEEQETQWMFENMDAIALKHGMFSHGYQVSDNDARLKKFEAIEALAKKRGIPVLTRGEMDGEMFVYGWSTKNIPQALYWSGLFATHCRLDVWNIPARALKDEANFPAFIFFNRYAGLHDASSSPRAFCALRDGLDASDFERFPASEFGGKEGNKQDVERYMKIAQAYAGYGARMDDPEKATGHGMVNRKSSGYNDAGWGILSGNYSRFLTQVNPGSGDVGLWNIDDTIYGRFARAFEHKSGKKQLRFKIDENFNADQVEVRVTYLDRGQGSWSLGVSDNSVKKLVHNSNSGKWKTIIVEMSGKVLHGTELQLNYEDGDDTIFHMLEVEKKRQ